jgi:hypothetical protein
VASLSQQLVSLQASQQSQLAQLAGNAQGSTSATSSSSSGGGIFGTLASSVLGGFSLTPIVEGILSLFGGSSQTVQPLVPFTLPPSINYAGGVSAGGVAPVDYGQNGQLRPVNSGGGSSTSNQTVQIQVNAMDSKSFLDHSEEIAQAVRQAILNSSSLNDVISDL